MNKPTPPRKVARIQATPKGLHAILAKEQLKIETLGLEYCLDLYDQQPLASSKNSDIVLIGSTFHPTKQFFEEFTNCKHIITCTSGTDHLDIPLLKQFNCKAYRMPQARAVDVTETTILYILEGLRKATVLFEETKAGKWPRDQLGGRYRLANQTVGIIGYGQIGKMVARYLTQFSPQKILIFDPFVTQIAEDKLFCRVDSVQQLINESFIISIHCNLNPTSWHLLGENNLGSLKEARLIINTARAQVIEESSLIRYLQNNKLARAYIDVFAEEPLRPDNAYSKVDNVFVSPHSSGYSEDMIHAIPDLVAEEINRILIGQLSPYLVE